MGWEFGAGNGHAVWLREVARYFPQQDHELQFALSNTGSATPSGLDLRFVVAAPGRPTGQPARQSIPRATYGEFVCEALMGEGRDMAGRLAEWARIITTFKPDVIVAEYAPALSLWARGRLPVVVTGSGYTLPPPEMAEFPRLTDKRAETFAPEYELVERLNKHLVHAGARPLELLPQINAADAHGLITLPVFDPYADHRTDPCLGIAYSGGAPAPRDQAFGLLAYFAESWQLDDAFTGALGAAGVPGKAYLGPPLRRTARKLAISGIALSDELFDLVREMPGKAVAVHMGTLGFASAAVLAGVPQVIITQNQENALIAEALSRMGVAFCLPRRDFNPARFSEMIREASQDRTMRMAAKGLAERMTPFRNSNPALRVAEMVSKLVG